MQKNDSYLLKNLDKNKIIWYNLYRDLNYCGVLPRVEYILVPGNNYSGLKMRNSCEKRLLIYELDTLLRGGDI